MLFKEQAVGGTAGDDHLEAGDAPVSRRIPPPFVSRPGTGPGVDLLPPAATDREAGGDAGGERPAGHTQRRAVRIEEIGGEGGREDTDGRGRWEPAGPDGELAWGGAPAAGPDAGPRPSWSGGLSGWFPGRGLGWGGRWFPGLGGRCFPGLTGLAPRDQGDLIGGSSPPSDHRRHHRLGPEQALHAREPPGGALVGG